MRSHRIPPVIVDIEAMLFALDRDQVVSWRFKSSDDDESTIAIGTWTDSTGVEVVALEERYGFDAALDALRSTLSDELDRAWESSPTIVRALNDANNESHAAHYGGADNPHEAIKVIEHYNLGFCLGNAIKYVLRAPFKGAHLDDLKKARWYIDREIARISNGS